ncbi:hypothetical protein JW848_03935 [Candidatus Bipolaricaulota bacterium]|nr:hypothetical protein [Candidatus Bipolaricaulota bacterium]
MTDIRGAAVPIEALEGEGWEATLRRLTSDMDPWDIDIRELAQRYREHITTLRMFQFEIPGRMVLTCSILLRMQSDVLLASARPVDQDGLIDELEDVVDDAAAEWDAPVEPDEFRLPLRRRPQRRVTLADLRIALSSAMTVRRRRAERLLHQVELEDAYDPFDAFEIGGNDFGDRLHALFDRIKAVLKGNRVTSFFRLLDRGDRDERIERFFEVLHLASQGRIGCAQEEFLGDILISLEPEEA